MTRARPARRSVPWLLLAALACGHEEPIAPGSGGATGPRAPGDPLQLTFSPDHDATPVWLAGGRGILHSFDRTLDGQFDRCLGFLPPGGGSRTFEFCATSPGNADSLDALEGAGASPGGRLIYQWSQSSGVRTFPNDAVLALASLDRPFDTQELGPVPYILPGGRTHAGIARVDWLDESTAVWLGEDRFYPRACSTCKPDTVRIGREGVRVSLAGPTPGLAIIPGTTDATSLAASPDWPDVFFTLPMDSRVYRVAPGGGTPAVVHDFGTGEVVRDVAVAGGRLVAVVGGFVELVDDPVLGVYQRDLGGRLVVLELDSGGVTDLPTTSLHVARRPFLAPAGEASAVVAELYLVVSGPPTPAVHPVPDLWRFEVP